MANCKATLSLIMYTVDVTDKDSVIIGLRNPLEEDQDLIENEDEFREDTLELGYDTEADRIINEYFESKGFPDSIGAFVMAFEEISKVITSQDFFSGCQMRFMPISETKVVVVFASGGIE